MRGGSVGGTVSLANSFPDLAMELFQYGQAGNEGKGRPLQERCLRINNVISGRYGVSGVKAAMNLAGFRGGIPRRPLLPLTRAQADELRKSLTEEGLI
jgi:4-hydroxy-2-oxoglutarate aldolase